MYKKCKIRVNRANKLFKIKRLWNKEEITKLLNSAILYGYKTCNAGGNIFIDKWIKENL